MHSGVAKGGDMASGCKVQPNALPRRNDDGSNQSASKSGWNKMIRVTLLDLGTSCEIPSMLSEIFATSPHLDADLVVETVSAYDLDSFDHFLSKLLLTSTPDLILVALPGHLLKTSGYFVRALKQKTPRTPLVAVVGTECPEDLFALFECGVVDFITVPFRPPEIVARVVRLLETVTTHDGGLSKSVKELIESQGLIGSSPAFQAEIRKIIPLADCDVSVLITGETGTGKELFARCIHQLGSRAQKPFVAVNCGAIPVELVENELFGHERGAFTGAVNRHIGLIQEAEGGTLFLDEVDSLPLLAQVKILRFLQEKEYRVLGSTKTLKGDVRIIAASNTNLEEGVKTGRFRQDLYYRLNVFPLHLPALRERGADIASLATHSLARHTAQFQKQIIGFSPRALQKMMDYHWPGNVRELENIVGRAVLVCEEEFIQSSHIILHGVAAKEVHEPLSVVKARKISEFERRYIENLLAAYEGNITKAAQAAQKERRTFWGLIRKHKIDVEKFRPVS